jgi:DNA topoisomerase-1
MATQTIKILEVLEAELASFLFADPDKRICPKCNKGELKLKNSKYSPFIACSLYPDCDYAENFKLFNRNKDDKKELVSGDKFFKEDKKSQPQDALLLATKDDNQILLCQGSYGPYLALAKEGFLEKTTSLTRLEGLDILSKTPFEQLKTLLEMPYALGKDADGNEIKIGLGKYGPYLLYKKKFSAIKNRDLSAIIHLTLEEAKSLLKIK